MQPARWTRAGHRWVLAMVLLVAVTQLLATSTAAARWAAPDVRTTVTETTGAPTDEMAVTQRPPTHRAPMTLDAPAVPAAAVEHLVPVATGLRRCHPAPLPGHEAVHAHSCRAPPSH